MFERMDARVRAGRRVPSNAGNGSEADARTSGVLLFGYCSLGQARESNSAAPQAMSKALDHERLNSKRWIHACAGIICKQGSNYRFW